MYDLFSLYADMVGIVGVILTLLAYYLLNLNKIKSDSMLYLLFNLVGSCLLMFSLLFNWNLSSVLIEIAWISISLIGIYRATRARKMYALQQNDNVIAMRDINSKRASDKK